MQTLEKQSNRGDRAPVAGDWVDVAGDEFERDVQVAEPSAQALEVGARGAGVDPEVAPPLRSRLHRQAFVAARLLRRLAAWSARGQLGPNVSSERGRATGARC